MRNRFHMPGQIPQKDLPDYFRSSDIYISASLSDGSSVSLMEALACGSPALVSDIPGNREWVQPGKQGWLFPAKKVAALEQLILQAANFKQFAKMSKGARKTAESKADWTKNKLGLYKAYQLAIEVGS